MALGIITLLIGMVLAVAGRVRRANYSVSCLQNLHQIAVGLQQYAATNGILPPSGQQTCEQILVEGDYITDPAIFRCPGDEEIFPKVGSSYDWRDTGRPDTTLAGRRLSDVPSRSNPVLAHESMPGWHAKKKINAVFLDGSAMTMDAEACFKDLETSVRPLPPGLAPPIPIPTGN